MISRNSTKYDCFVLISLVLCTCFTNLFLFFSYWYWDRNLFGNRNYIHCRVECFWSEGKSRRESIKTTLSLLRTSQKDGSKIASFYCRNTYRDWAQIGDPQILTVGSPIESEDMRFWIHFFWEVTELRESFWYLDFEFFLRIKSIRPDNVYSFDFQRDFGLNIDSWKIKKDS